ncbi:MAG: hypothetical protein WC551_12795 [Patescibacteria group bacterium]
MAKSSIKNPEQQDGPAAGPSAAVQEPGARRKEKFFRIKPHAKSRPDDDENVVVSVNGEILVMERTKECVIPERFVVALQNARSPVFKQMPGESRKIEGEIMTFPFDILSEGTEEEYLTMKRTGTAQTKDVISKMGLKDR